MIIDCKKIAQNILDNLKNQPKPEKFLAAVLVSEDKASISFLNQKEKAAKTLGLDFRLYKFPADIKTPTPSNKISDRGGRGPDQSVRNDKLRKEVLKIAQHKTCGGVIIQLPLPDHINKYYILNVIPREKDIDVLGERALGAFYTGRNPVLPPAVGVVQEILQTLNFELLTAKVAVVGLGFLVGKPVSVWLEGKAKEIILFDEGSDFLLLREADLVISGVGKAGIIKPDMLKEEAVVIDFGYDGGRGDLDISDKNSEFIIQHSISYTPTPGGTGPILVAKLLENFYVLSTTHSRRD